MSWQDLVNGAFELGGGVLMWLNVIAIKRDKKLHGIALVPSVLFTTWGYWNLYYYPSFGQWFSFIGALSIVIANTVWLYYAFKYRNNTTAV